MFFGEIFWIVVGYSFIMALVFRLLIFPRILFYLSSKAVEDTEHQVEGEKRFYISPENVTAKDVLLIISFILISGPLVWARLAQLALFSRA
jgi:energy-converting hydrogenase Eha subunit H